MGRQKVEADIVVVGAGLAGLSAARSLRASGCDVAVVEARDRVGGRVLNHRLPGGEVIEIGGQWIGPQQLRINKLVAELGLETFPTYDTGENLLDLDGKVKHYTGEIPPLPKAALVDLGQSQLRFDRLGEAGAARGAVGGRPGGALGRGDVRDLDAAQHAHRERPVLLGGVLRGGVRGRAAGHVVAARARVHALGRWREQPDRVFATPRSRTESSADRS